jgi:hypothetical protein
MGMREAKRGCGWSGRVVERIRGSRGDALLGQESCCMLSIN